MSPDEQQYYETVSGKFAAYDLLIAHLLRKTLAKSDETERDSLRQDLLRQLNVYTAQPQIPAPAKAEMQRTVTEILQKAEHELQTLT